jgi:hypothetical protein
MQSTQNLPTIEDEALDGVSGGASLGSLRAQAVGMGVKTTARIASGQFAFLGAVFTGISDMLNTLNGDPPTK